MLWRDQRKNAFREALQARCAELQDNSQELQHLSSGLTKLSKNEGADEETKSQCIEI